MDEFDWLNCIVTCGMVSGMQSKVGDMLSVFGTWESDKCRKRLVYGHMGHDRIAVSNTPGFIWLTLTRHLFME